MVLNLNMKYLLIKKALVSKLKALAKKADMVWLASDEDREGEAISWHLAEELKLDKTKQNELYFMKLPKLLF
jgi:DNA topoisomerase-1